MIRLLGTSLNSSIRVSPNQTGPSGQRTPVPKHSTEVRARWNFVKDFDGRVRMALSRLPAGKDAR